MINRVFWIGLICAFIISCGSQRTKLENEKGIDFYNSGDYIKSEEVFRDLIKKNEGDIYILKWYTKSLVKNSKYSEVIPYLNEIIDSDQNYVQAYDDRGFAYMKQGLFEKAFHDFSVVLDSDSLNHIVLTNRGYCAIELENYETAISDLNKATQIKIDYAPAYNSIGIIMFLKGNVEESIKYFNAAIKFNSDYLLAHQNRADALLKLEEYELAYEEYNNVISLDSQSAKAYLSRGIVQFFVGDTIRACEDWEMANKYGNQDAVQYTNEYCR